MADLCEVDQTVMEERMETMVAPTGGIHTMRRAHFLKPSSLTSDHVPVFYLPFDAVPETNSENCRTLRLSYRGRRNMIPDPWKLWVESMRVLHQSKWKQVGIYDAIMGSTYIICRDDDLILGLARKWSPKTNSFVFDWGEATITLEDIMVLGGFSVLGDSVRHPIEDGDMKEVRNKLLKARSEITKTKRKRACQTCWMKRFMNSESEIEHEAFLVMWLSRFVFPLSSSGTIGKDVLGIAIHLARGRKLALAPAVLAGIYNQLSLIKKTVLASKKKPGKCDNPSELSISAPFDLVQIWAWERFPMLLQKPHRIVNGQPMAAKWSELKAKRDSDVSSALNSAADDFLWRPYAVGNNGLLVHQVYGERETRVIVDSDTSASLAAHIRCIRVSELVGVDCIEQYLPHRVAMQFGMDQDLPGHAPRYNMTPETAWGFYTRPIADKVLYLPSGLFESDVTISYHKWQRKQMLPCEGISVSVAKGKNRDRSDQNHLALKKKRFLLADMYLDPCCEKASDADGTSGTVEKQLHEPPGFLPKGRKEKLASTSGVEDSSEAIASLMNKQLNSGCKLGGLTAATGNGGSASRNVLSSLTCRGNTEDRKSNLGDESNTKVLRKSFGKQAIRHDDSEKMSAVIDSGGTASQHPSSPLAPAPQEDKKESTLCSDDEADTKTLAELLGKKVTAAGDRQRSTKKFKPLSSVHSSTDGPSNNQSKDETTSTVGNPDTIEPQTASRLDAADGKRTRVCDQNISASSINTNYESDYPSMLACEFECWIKLLEREFAKWKCNHFQTSQR